MKLLYCSVCADMFSLSFKEKHCSCGAAKGYYEVDGIHAVFTGGIPVGISNDSFSKAMSKQTELDQQDNTPFSGTKFEAWIVPANSNTFNRMTKQEIEDFVLNKAIAENKSLGLSTFHRDE